MKAHRSVRRAVAVPALSALLASGLLGLEFETRAISRTDPSLPNVTAAFDSALGVPGYAVTDDGSAAVFTGWSPNLLQGFTLEVGDVLLFAVADGSIAPVSHRHDDPTIGGNHFSQFAAISGDGSTVLFSSLATDLVAGYSGSESQLYAANLSSGEIELVSSAWNDTLRGSNGLCWPFAISDTGRYVYFTTSATDLIEGYSGQGEQIYLADLVTGSVTLVTHAWNSTITGASGSLWHEGRSATADGRYVAFASQSADLIPGNSGEHLQVYLFDRNSGTVSLVSHAAGSPAQVANESSGEVALSSSGSHLAFRSAATDLVAGSQVSGFQVYLVEIATGELTLASSALNSPSNGGNDDSTLPSLSGDGRYLSFTTLASDLVDGVAPGNSSQVVLFDRANGDRLLATHTPLGPTSASAGGSYRSTVSRDGVRVVFDSAAVDLVFPPLPFWNDFQVYSFEIATGQVRLLTRTFDDPLFGGSAQTLHHSISADGTRVIFDSDANDFVEGDWNAGNDVFSSDPLSGDLVTISRRDPDMPISRTANGASLYSPAGGVSDDGRFVYFESSAKNLAPGMVDVVSSDSLPFLYDAQADSVTWLGSHLARSAPLGGIRWSTPSNLSFGNFAEGGHPISSDASVALYSGSPGGAVPWQAFAYLRREEEDRLLSHRFDEPSQPGNANSIAVSASAGGRFVALTSEATDLIEGFQGTGYQLYLHDLVDGTLRLVTHQNGAPTTASAGNWSFLGISFDGRWTAFASDGTDLLPTHSGGTYQTYLYDAADGSIRLASHVAGDPSTGCSEGAGGGGSMSQDGRWLVFTSRSGDLVGQPGSFAQVQAILWDRVNSTHRLVSHSIAGNTIGSNARALDPRVSRDGRFVGFVSQATDLVPGYEVLGTGSQVYRFDRSTGLNTLVSHSLAGPNHGATGDVWTSSISADGSRFALYTYAEDLIPGAPGRGIHVYLYDAPTDAFTILTAYPDGDFPIPMPGSDGGPEISADGRAVVFDYNSSYLVERDWNVLATVWDVFLVEETPAGLIFRDGFASGDASRWSSSSGGE